MTRTAAPSNSSLKRNLRGSRTLMYSPRRFGLILGKSSGSSSSDCMVLPHLQLTQVDGLSMDGGRHPGLGIADILHHIDTGSQAVVRGWDLARLGWGRNGRQALS